MLSVKQKDIEIVAVIIIISIMLIVGQMDANADKEEGSLATLGTTPSSDNICCIAQKTNIDGERAKELTFGPAQCPSIPLTVTLTTINEQIEACMVYEKHGVLSHILNKPHEQIPLTQYKNHKFPKEVDTKESDDIYKAPRHIRF